MMGSSAGITPKDEIVIKGSHFFFQNGTQFFIRGVTYNAPGSDAPRGDRSYDVFNYQKNIGCRTDIPDLLALGINAVYLEGLHFKESHVECMQYFQDAGIYVLVSLATYDDSYFPIALFVGSDGTASGLGLPAPSWNGDIWDAYTALIDQFASFSNLLGFIIGESYNMEFGFVGFADGLPFAKAATRDMKAYMTARGYRKIPIGFLGEDTTMDVDLGASYLNCGNISESVDFWAVDTLGRWCGGPSSTTNLTTTYGNFGIPVLLGLYGCFSTPTDDLTEVGVLYGSKMATIFSGGFYSTWYGVLVNDPDASDNSDQETLNLTSYYTAMAVQLASATPSATHSATYTPSNSILKACPTGNKAWSGLQKAAPAPNKDLCQCMYNSLTCRVPETWVNDLWNWSNVTARNWTAYVGLQSNGTNSTYGAYSVCNKFQRVSWSIDQLYKDNITLGGSATCNSLTNGNAQSPAPPAYSCSAMLASVGPLGDHVVAPSATASFTDSTSADYYSGRPGLSGGAIAGVVIGMIFAAAISAGSALLWWKRRKAKANLSPDGLEVVMAPDSELPGDVPTKSEMWTTRNTIELPASEGVKLPDTQSRGSYTPVGNEISEEATELDSSSHLSPSLGNSPRLGAENPHQSIVSRSNSHRSPLSSNSPGAGPKSPQDAVSPSNSYLIPYLGNSSAPGHERSPSDTVSPRTSRISSMSNSLRVGLETPSQDAVSPTSQINGD